MAPNERAAQNSRKEELNEMEISNLSDAEFKTLVIRMLRELNEDLSSIKNDPVRHKRSTN